MQNLRIGAAQALRTLRPTRTTSTSTAQIGGVSGNVKISDLSFSVDPQTQRAIDEARSKIRDQLMGGASPAGE